MTKSVLPVLIVWAAISAVVYDYFDFFFTRPNNILLDTGTDGIKNYFTFSYHLKHGSAFWFEGMAYPYGEHLIFADSQFPVLYLFRFLNNVGIDLSDKAVGCVHVAILIGFYLAGLFLYRLFRYEKLPVAPSVILAVLITLGSPQIFRIQMHHALSYVCVFPMFLFYLLRYIRENRNRDLIFLMIVMGFFGLVHSYLLFAMLLLLGGYLLLKVLFDRSVRWGLALALVVPAVLYLGVLEFTDPVQDRPEIPYGHEEHKANPGDVLWPLRGTVSNAIDRFGLEINHHYTEGYSYPGILAWLVILLFFPVLGYALLTGKEQLLRFFRAQKEYYFLAIPATLVLCYAMYLPFRWTGEQLLEIIPFIGQFRGIGRLTWIFYYTITVVCGIMAVRFRHYLPVGKAVRVGIFGILCLIWMSSISGNLGLIKTNIDRYSGANLLLEDRLVADVLERNGYAADDFQAVLSIPFSTIGNEIFWFLPGWSNKTAVWAFSYQTGIPSTIIYLSRVSMARTLDILSLGNRSIAKRPILESIDRDKSLLVVCTRSHVPEYAHLLELAAPIDSVRDLVLYDLSPSAFNPWFPSDSIQKIKASWSSDKHMYFSDPAHPFVVSRFERPDQIFRIRDGAREILSVDVPPARDTNYVLSFWVRPSITHHNGTPVFEIRQINEQGDLVTKDEYRETFQQQMDAVGDWVRYTRQIRLEPEAQRIILYGSGQGYHIGDLLLRPLDTHVLDERRDYALINNLIVEKALVK